MKVVVAPDSFKESLSAREAAHHISQGIAKFNSHVTVAEHPMSDGGEGMLETLLTVLPGNSREVDTFDPLGRKIKSVYGFLKDPHTALIEIAKASGLALVESKSRNISSTSTFGTGFTIQRALDYQPARIIIGLGGSGTNDGGTGMARALGIRFLNASGKELREGGGFLDQLDSIDVAGLDPRILNCEVIGACDVQNPLTGRTGATRVYGPQKGGSESEIKQVESNMIHYSRIIERDLGLTIDGLAGAGAAGGTGAAIVAFLGGTLKPGFSLIAEQTGLEAKIREADLVITGEGRFDSQSQFGKTPMGVIHLCQRHKKRVFVMAGSAEISPEVQDLDKMISIYTLRKEGLSLEESIRRTGELLEKVVFEAMGDFVRERNG